MKRLTRPSAFVAAICLAASFASIASAAPPQRDITSTNEGRNAAAEAALRSTQKGFPTKAADLQVWQFSSGNILVVPRGFEVLAENSVVTPRAQATRSTDEAISEMSAAGMTSATAAAAPYWKFINGTCFSRFTRANVHIDACYRMNRLVNDGTTTYDFYELHFFATAGVNDNAGTLWQMQNAWVASSAASGSTAQSWWDWDPGSDISGNCRTIGLSVTGGVGGASLGITHNHEACEVWDITKYAAPGSFRTTWRGHTTGDREAAFAIVSRVGQGKSPVGNLNWDVLQYCHPDFDCNDG
jgi:hypothetical protein